MNRNERKERGASTAPWPFFKTVAEEVAELQKLDVPALAERYRLVFGREPRIRSQEALWKEIARKVQENRMGSPPAAEPLVASFRLPERQGKRILTRPGQLRIGSVITRKWHSRTITLRVLDGGFEMDGVVYKSLSAAAKALTGSHWNGPFFWGLKPRRKP